MNIKACLIFGTLIPIVSLSAQSPQSLNQIIKERGVVLQRIVESLEKQFSSGGAESNVEQQLQESKINLYAFRRDNAKTLKERRDWQMKVISSEEERNKLLQQRHDSTGSVSELDILRSRDRLLAARQKLFEMESGNKGSQ